MDEENNDMIGDRISMAYIRRLELAVDRLLDELTASWVSDDPMNMRFQWLDDAVLLEKHIYRGELTGVLNIDLMELLLHDGHGSCVSGGFNHIIRIEEVESREDEYGW